MSPLPYLDNQVTKREFEKPTNPNTLVVEAWAEGYMVGSLIIMSCITLANMRRGVLLHKLILLELVFGYWQGFFTLFNQPIYAWWLSVAAIPLNTSWVLHNIISWMKLRPFLSKFWSRVFIGTIMLSIPYWVVEIYANFTYFHNVNHVFLKTRPWEALCRDPWWVAAAVILFYNIKTKYDLGAFQIVQISPRFAVMLGAMILSIVFIVLDVLSVTGVLPLGTVGINPFWKLSFVFKCLTDSVVLDDFKTALDRLRAFKISRLGSFAIDTGDTRMKEHTDAIRHSNAWDEPPPSGQAKPIGNLPALPDSVTGTPYQPESTTVEDKKFAGIARTASRDRDLEENGIPSLDHESYDRQASNAPMLSPQSNNWSYRQSVTTSDGGDFDYATAMREVTNESSRNKAGHGIGIEIHK